VAINVDSENIVAGIGLSAAAFLSDVQKQFAAYEGSSTRVFNLKETYDDLAGLSHHQKSLFSQAMTAIEVGLFRAAVVLAWAGFIDVLEAKLSSDGWVKANSVWPTFPISKTLEELRESYTEHAFIILGKECGLYGKQTMNTLHGALSERNQCAHPGNADPGMNEALGYVSKLLKRAKDLESRSL